MSEQWIRVFGISMVVCMLAILAVPALAADPYQDRDTFATRRGLGLPAPLRFAGTLITSIPVIGIPLGGILVARSLAESVLHHPITGNLGGRVTGLDRGLRREMGAGTINRSAVSVLHQPLNMSEAGAARISAAENLTVYLGGKGYEVTDLDASLSEARSAIQTSNLTAFRSAMNTFMRELNGLVVAGTVNRTVIQQFLKTQPTMDPAGKAWRAPARRIKVPSPRGYREAAPTSPDSAPWMHRRLPASLHP
jgi:hypothetical protein